MTPWSMRQEIGFSVILRREQRKKDSGFQQFPNQMRPRDEVLNESNSVLTIT